MVPRCAAGVAAAIAMLLTACGSTSGVRDVVVNLPSAQLVQLTGCPRDSTILDHSDQAVPATGPVPAGYVPITVTQCTEAGAKQVGAGYRRTIHQQQAPVTRALLQALALPDQQFADPQQACVADGGRVTSMYLTDENGATMRVRLPRSPCSIREEAASAVLELRFGKATSFQVDVPQ